MFASGFMLENLQHLAHLGIDPAQPEQTHWRDVYRRAGAYEARKLESALKVRSLAAQTAIDMVEVQPATVAGHSQTGELDAAQSEGLQYWSVRNSGAICWGIFTPRNIQSIVQTAHYEFIVRGGDIVDRRKVVGL